MTRTPSFYGYDLLADKARNLKGRLIVLEGTDGVGRSSQIALLREWLENEGYAVATSALKRGKLAGKGLKEAMRGHTLGDTTMNLLYATDFADRLEHEMLPALRAGFIVLTDRYIFSIIVRALVRGADPAWIRNLFSFALVPDIVFYLQADVSNLVPRVLNARGFDYWESGLDLLPGRDYYENFIEYQRRLLAQFDAIANEYGFHRIDANRSMHAVFKDLQTEIKRLIADMKPNRLALTREAGSELEEVDQPGKKNEK
ncbi:MAG TPA: thymidylate kinase [Chloroflexi bacterium]|nr:thymidylate kinase [Chloroflexota bacterium]